LPQQQLQTAQLHPLTAAEIPTVIDIGRSIWLEHYVPLIGEAQVNYMTSQRFTTEYLSRYLPENATGDDGQPVRWLDLLRLEGETVGYCSHSLGPNPTELKLEQLYLLPGLHGRGLGGLMMRHIEQHARSLGRTTLWLTVNKHNAVHRRL
jgi:GNAT superfamily N-acetyltransferase